MKPYYQNELTTIYNRNIFAKIKRKFLGNLSTHIVESNFSRLNFQNKVDAY
jgi:hypothetical protein